MRKLPDTLPIATGVENLNDQPDIEEGQNFRLGSDFICGTKRPPLFEENFALW